MKDNNAGRIDPIEFDAAKRMAKKSKFTFYHKLRTPLTYLDKTYDELTFEWNKLTGLDSLNIINEVAIQEGKTVVAPALSPDYLVRMAAHACTEPIAHDALLTMSLYDFNKIMDAARSFLLQSES